MDRDGPESARFTWALAALLAGAALLFLVRLGEQGVVSEEVRWAEVAREMRASGDWLRPTINGQVYYDKPVGSYWLIVAVSGLLGGVDEFGARLPAALAGVVGVGFAARLGRRLYGGRAGLAAGAVLATCYGYAFYARRATADVETVTGVLIAVWLYAVCESRRNRAWVVGLWVWMALVSMTKGLPGFALPVAVFLADGLMAAWTSPRPPGRERFGWLLTPWTLVAVPLAVAVYLTPFLLSVWESGDAVGLEMVWRENVKRFVAPHNHKGPVYLYFGVIFVLAAPWSAFLPAALWPARAAGRGDRLARAYFFAVFLLFTASASRRSYYLLPVLPPLALLIGRLLTAPGDELPTIARRLRAGGYWVLGLFTVAGGLALLPPAWVLPAPHDRLPPLPGRAWLAAGWLLGLVAVARAARYPHSPRALPAVAGVFAAFCYVFLVALPSADDLRTRRDFLAEVRRATDADPGRLGLFHASDTVFDLGRTAPEFSAAKHLLAARPRWVVTPRRRLPELPGPRVILIEEASQPWETDEAGNKLVLLELPPGGAP